MISNSNLLSVSENNDINVNNSNNDVYDNDESDDYVDNDDNMSDLGSIDLPEHNINKEISRNSMTSQHSMNNEMSRNSINKEISRNSMASQHSMNNEMSRNSINKEISRNSMTSQHSMNNEMSRNSINKEISRNSMASQHSMNNEMSRNSINKEISRNSMTNQDSINKLLSRNSMNKELSRNSMNKELSHNSMTNQDSINKLLSRNSMNKEISHNSMNKELSRNSMNKEVSRNSMNNEVSRNSMNNQDSIKKLLSRNSMNKEISRNSMNKEISRNSMNKEISRNSINNQVEENVQVSGSSQNPLQYSNQTSNNDKTVQNIDGRSSVRFQLSSRRNQAVREEKNDNQSTMSTYSYDQPSPSSITNDKRLTEGRSLKLLTDVAQLRSQNKRYKNEISVLATEVTTLQKSMKEERERRWDLEKKINGYVEEADVYKTENEILKNKLHQTQQIYERKMNDLMLRMDTNMLRKDLEEIQQRCMTLEEELHNSHQRESELASELGMAKLEESRLLDIIARKNLETRDIHSYRKVVKWLSGSYFVKLFRMRKFLRSLSLNLHELHQRLRQGEDNTNRSLPFMERLQHLNTITEWMDATTAMLLEVLNSADISIQKSQHWKSVADNMFTRVVSLTNEIKSLETHVSKLKVEKANEPNEPYQPRRFIRPSTAKSSVKVATSSKMMYKYNSKAASKYDRMMNGNNQITVLPPTDAQLSSSDLNYFKHALLPVSPRTNKLKEYSHLSRGGLLDRKMKPKTRKKSRTKSARLKSKIRPKTASPYQKCG